MRRWISSPHAASHSSGVMSSPGGWFQCSGPSSKVSAAGLRAGSAIPRRVARRAVMLSSWPLNDAVLVQYVAHPTVAYAIGVGGDDAVDGADRVKVKGCRTSLKRALADG